jgi:hypothetical protein
VLDETLGASRPPVPGTVKWSTADPSAPVSGVYGQFLGSTRFRAAPVAGSTWGLRRAPGIPIDYFDGPCPVLLLESEQVNRRAALPAND